MSIALGRSNRIEGLPGFVAPIYEGVEMAGGASLPVDRRLPATGRNRVGVKARDGDGSSSCSSSIGRNSDCSKGSEGEDSGEAEVQSALKGPLDTMDALEDCLPIKRGISSFYRGKSKSFTSLADVSFSSSAKDLAKPENSYTRKRKNLLAFSRSGDSKCSNHLAWTTGDSICKRHSNANRSTPALAAATLSSSNSNSSCTSEDDHDLDHSPLLPPRHPHGKASHRIHTLSPQKKCALSVRSFSLTDLQCAANSSTSSPLLPGDELERFCWNYN